MIYKIVLILFQTSQLFADLGGCLGLYIGVSLLTILEVFELLKSIVIIIRKKLKVKPNEGSRIYWLTGHQVDTGNKHHCQRRNKYQQHTR